MDKDISPCPNCERKDAAELHQTATGNFFVKCMKCKQEGPIRATSEAAIEAWNRRDGLVRITSE